MSPIKTRLRELETRRWRFFFWLGLFVLPVFWVWWMRPSYFTQTQRIAGWVWTACYIGLGIVFRKPLELRVDDLRIGYDLVASQIAFGLWLWLLFRLFGVGRVIFLFIVSIDTIAILLGLPSQPPAQPSPTSLLFPLIPAILHLLVDPVRRWMRRNSPEVAE